jgi:hypothetical protein
LDGNRTFSVQGPAWLKDGEGKHLTPKALAAKILCTRHNEALGPLDTLAKKTMEFVFKRSLENEVLTINGGELERWFLKVMCGQIASGWTSLTDYEIPENWLNILFGDDIVPTTFGISILRGRDIVTNQHQVGAWLIESETPKFINGLYFLIAGFQFLFFMDRPKHTIPERLKSFGWEMVHRPECLVLIVDGKQREVHFGPNRNGYVVIKTGKH